MSYQHDNLYWITLSDPITYWQNNIGVAGFYTLVIPEIKVKAILKCELQPSKKFKGNV